MSEQGKKDQEKLCNISIKIEVDGTGKPQVTTQIDAPEGADVQVDTDSPDQARTANVTVNLSLDLKTSDQAQPTPTLPLRPVDDEEEQ
jgi:hypothetical protein